MSTWIILSWVFVLILTAVNVVVFIKLKSASEQMMKMAFPGAANMNEAVAQMQKMMGNTRGGRPGFPGGGGKGQDKDAQLRSAMQMLQQMQKGGKR
jgi:hypothetical protein